MGQTFLGSIELLSGSCNPATVSDGRGGIFSWVPEDDIKEFAFLFFNPGKIRGNHYHPEFVEYFLVVEGAVLVSTIDVKTNNIISKMAGVGTCFRTPIGVSHAVQAIVASKCISFLTKPWDECVEPIIYTEILK
jgi:dTDP-4-dehydrorhamnose 3,5-epimerase-like enzyme